MSFRLPQGFSTTAAADARHDALEAEVLAEKASALSRAGRRVEATLEALRGAPPEERDERLDDAAEATWAFLTQREICGLRDRDRVVADYAIPREVLNRMGATRRAKKGESE